MLRACLLPDDDARKAWIAYQRQGSDLKQRFRADPRSRRLAPLLLAALERNAAPADKALLTVLRTAQTREELRSRIYRDILRVTLAALNGIPFLVLKGAALGDTLYHDPTLRHSHDIDLLIQQQDRPRIETALERVGFVSKREDMLVHDSGLPVLLHTRLFSVPHYHSDFQELWTRRDNNRLSSADNLVHACVHASYSPRRGTLQWVCDAWLLADAQPDWDVVLQASEFSGIALPQYVALRYLATELRVPVPDAVLQHLGSLAARADACDRDAALFGARQGAPPIPGAANWQTRLTLARWHLLPSRAYLQESDSAGGAGSLWRYANRPLKYVANRLSRRFRLPRALSPEERLLLALAKVSTTPTDQQMVRKAQHTRAFSWDRLVGLAANQHVLPLLANALGTNEHVPPEVRRRLHMAQVLSNLRFTQFLAAVAPVTNRFVEESIEVVLLKGAAMAATVYPTGMRPLNDLDLLIDRKDYAKAAEILESCGFIKAPKGGRSESDALRDYHQIVFEKRLGKEVFGIDLHWQIYPAGRAFQIPAADLFIEAKPVDLGPLRALAPSPETVFVHYATQLVNDNLQFKLSRAADLHALACSELDWDRVADLACRAGAAGATRLAMALSVDRGADAVPPKILSRLDKACPGSAAATKLAADPLFLFDRDKLHNTSVCALMPLFYSSWQHRVRYLLRLHPLRAGLTVPFRLLVHSHQWANSTRRTGLANRLRALLWPPTL